MAHGTPMVLTPVAAEGLDLVDGQEAFVESEPARYADRCADLLDNPARASVMGAAGRRRWALHHRPEVAIQRIAEIVGT
jgi:glycosyltransferase involved in cell wall biosynthesis